MFENVISLGYLCWTAMDMERLGFRSSSGPFDWVVTYEVRSIIELIENHFDGFLNYNNLYQNEKWPNIYKDKKYNIQFNHDFTSTKPLGEQIETVRAKYKRRIDRFYDEIQRPTLFIRYIISEDEKSYFEDNYDTVLKILKEYNNKNELVLIAHEDVTFKKISGYNVVRDTGISSTLYPIQKNAALYNYIRSNYDNDKLENNLAFLKAKNDRNEEKRTPMIKRIVRHFIKNKLYVHERQYKDG